MAVDDVFRLAGVTRRFGGRAALGPIDLAFARGQTCVVLGPSGCGKSTLLRLLVGLLAPDEGTVLFEGAPLSPPARLRMGYVIQEGGLFPHMTAARNVTLMARQQRWPAARIAARLEELAALARFPTDALARYPAELSGGQRQRVGLMRALMLDPDALLLDEPLGALDPLVRAELQEDLRGIFRTLAKTVVLVTHDLGEAAFLGERLILLRDGIVVQDGSVADLLERPADPFVSRFIGAQRRPLS